MTADQWITLASNGGIGLVALLVVVYVIVPSFRDEAKATRDTIAEGAKITAAAVDRMARGVGDLSQRVARIEGAIDLRERTDPGPAIAAGSADTPVLRPVRGR